jgi:protein Tex
MLKEPLYPQEIAQALTLKEFQVTTVLEFVKEGATVPFIARYRKERTGNLDENQIRDIIELQTKIENLYKAKLTTINGITEMGAMTDELMANILKAKTLKEVEEIYKPYKSKKKTKAMIAIEK